MGFDAHSERYLDRRSRVDVLTRPAWVVEVQLSGETEISWLERTRRYGGNVTWLFSPDSSLSSREAALERDGVVQLVRVREPQTDRDHSDVTPPLGTSSIDIGLRTARVGDQAEFTKWYRLEDCTFDVSGGLRAPDFIRASAWIDAGRKRQRTLDAEAADASAAIHADTEEVVRKSDTERATRLAEARLRWQRERLVGRVSFAPGRPRPAPPEEMRGPRPTVFTLTAMRDWERRHGIRPGVNGLMERILVSHSDDYRWRTGWIDGGWLAHLAERLVDPAWVALYLTILAPAGRLNQLVDREIDPDHSIIRRMQVVGLIEIGSLEPERMYHTIHDLRLIGTPFEYHQPMAYTD